MKLSIFTPTHNSKYLNDVYNSIKNQDFDEWVILYNNEAKKIGFADPRVKEIVVDIEGIKNVGMCKKLACANCSGDILIELDHDDLLTPNAAFEVKKAFENPEVGFVYSNSLYTDMNFGKREKFNPAFGWKYRETEYKGHLLDEPITFPLTPSSVSRIWYAPDHLRAFRKEVYNQVGGHNADLEILDDQDLMCRMYQVTKFHHIDKGLYVYRVHGDNSWLQKNKKIQDGVYPLYDKYIEDLILKW
jgi:glycosyltransferase involved in cell wall biosynthesis